MARIQSQKEIDMAKKKRRNKQNKVAQIMAGILASVVLALAVISGVGFGVYGTDVAQWFKATPANVEEETHFLQVGDQISFSESVEGLSLYLNTSDEALSKLDAFVNEKIAEQTESFDQMIYILAGLSNPQLTEPINFDDDSCFDNTILFCVVIEADGYYYLGAISSAFEVKEGIILYESEESKEGESQGGEYIAEDGRLLLPVENQREFYVGDSSLYIAEGFTRLAGEELTNTLLSTVPFNA